MEKWLSMKDVVRLSKLPETTLRRYINVFQEFVDTREFGKHKKYSSDVPELMVRIAELYSQNKNTSEIQEILAKENIITIHPTTTDDENHGFLIPSMNHFETFLKQNQFVVDSLQEVIRNQKSEIESLKNKTEYIEKELEELKEKVQPKKKRWYHFFGH